MGRQRLKAKDLKQIGGLSNTARSIALNIANDACKRLTKEAKIAAIRSVTDKPEDYGNDEVWMMLVRELMPESSDGIQEEFAIESDTKPYGMIGSGFVDSNTRHQMSKVMQLPTVIKGALMPDAHVGYGMPIGGVVATRNSVIPYAVGLDIGCRMALSIYEVKQDFLNRHSYEIQKSLKNETFFGKHHREGEQLDHPVLEDNRFGEFEILKKLRGKAALQLGSSGSGNHFVEFGTVDMKDNNCFGLPSGKYIGLLSHSGSRGMGAMIAKHYMDVAMQSCRLPKGYENLAWLDLDSDNGREYWLAMNLAGDYATACHDVIHDQLERSLGLESILNVENHHNFAWKEMHDRNELVVHRKGATPAKKGVTGIIPGSMTAPGYIVVGLGNEGALNSASHGAGRRWSRSRARSSTTMSALKKKLSEAGVKLIGGGIDESPEAYKDINKVIAAQTELVSIQGSFLPKIVRMDKN